VDLSKDILAAARSEMRANAREIGGNNRGPFVAKYLEPSGLRPPQPWCAAFASWCLLRAAEKRDLKPFPYFVSAREMFNWARAGGFLVEKPKPGSLVFFSRGGLFSWKGHCGIVSGVTKSRITVIEGNRSSRVQAFGYDPRQIRNLLGFAGIISQENGI
jgi:hypothetical protein